MGEVRLRRAGPEDQGAAHRARGADQVAGVAQADRGLGQIGGDPV
jgi:hypothetical protein